jgi:ABC-type transport system substrate-binding protein
MSRYRSLGLLAVVILTSGWLAAQSPRKEEEEEVKEKDKARPVVPVPVAEPDKKDAPSTDADRDVGSFKDEMAKANHAAGRELFKKLITPYDRLAPNFAGGRAIFVELLPYRDLPEEEFTVQRLDPALKNSSEQKLATGSGFTFTPFELIVLEEVDKFLARDLPALDRDEKLDYAARAVASGLRWHLVAVNNNKRVGKPWELVARQLRDRHLSLVRERFRLLVTAKKYEKADEVGLKMLSRYPDNNEVLRDVYRLQLLRTRDGLKDPTDAQLVKLRESLVLYERLPGPKDDSLIGDARRRLRDRATALVAEAKAFDSKKMTAEALAKLRQAELLDPDLPGIAGIRGSLRGKVLYVGVARLPERMSPATAELDSERWATELIFEGLLQAIPDSDVIRYRPALAESLPAVMPLGRSFTLPRNVRWSRDDGSVVDARDVRDTLNLLRRPGMRDRWAADGLDVFEEIDRVVDPFKLRLAYRHGVLEPLGRATFKVIPAQYLQQEQKAADDEGFARQPFGSGPFRYEGREKEPITRDGIVRECAVFRANPHYGQRPGKYGLPWIREIRFFVPDQSSIASDVVSGQLHLFPDAPTELAQRFRGDEGLKDTMRVSRTVIDRRTHILAINHRKAPLQNDKLRQGLSAAINREAILKDVFRAGDEKAHAALTGPFPIRSWATPPTARLASLYQPGAGGLITEGLNGRGSIRLRLVFLADDPKKPPLKNSMVCQAIKAQIEQASADKSGRPQVEIDLMPMSAVEFGNKLYREFDYDLALTTFDFRDDLYSLASFLDPEVAELGGRNYLGYLASGTNPTEGDRRLRRLIEEARQYRDFSKQVKDKTWDIHALFNQRMPYIPLWQLDRNMVVHKNLEIYFDNPDIPAKAEQLDPAVVFTGVEMWRLK